MYQTEGKTKDPYLSKGKDGVIRTLYNCQGCYGTFLAPIIKGKVHLCSSCQREANTIKEATMTCPKCKKELETAKYYGDAVAIVYLEGNVAKHWEDVELISCDDYKYNCPNCQANLTDIIIE